jgi:Ca-activated chloride channel family protein
MNILDGRSGGRYKVNRTRNHICRAALLLVAVPSPAQSAAETSPAANAPITTLKIDTRIVSVSAIVRDAAGKPVTSLTRDSFLLKQDGKPQQITYFSQGSDVPLTLALMVDTSGSQRSYIADEIAASRLFFRTMLKQPEDRAVLVQFDDHVLQLAKLTTNATTLEHALAYLSQDHSAYASFIRGGGGTLLYDAVSGVAHLALSDRHGRRAMVILTDGGDNGSEVSEKKAIQEAQRADIMIYSVYYSNGGGDLGVLKEMSKATGGRVFTVSSTMPLTRIYAEIANDMRLEYELGYRPPDSKPNKLHKIELRTTDKKMTVQARDGYFTPAAPPRAAAREPAP